MVSSLEVLIDADTSLGVTAEAVSSTSSPFGIVYGHDHNYTGTYPNLDTNLTAVTGETVRFTYDHQTLYEVSGDTFVEINSYDSTNYTTTHSYHEVSEHQTPEDTAQGFVRLLHALDPSMNGASLDIGDWLP